MNLVIQIILENMNFSSQNKNAKYELGKSNTFAKWELGDSN